MFSRHNHSHARISTVCRSMSRRMMAGALGALMLSSCAGLPGALPIGLGEPARVDGAALMADVTILADDRMQGREVGTEGAALAREYIISRYQQIGIQSFGDGYETGFTAPANRRRGEREGVNVAGWLPGRTDNNRVIVITAHYDHVGVHDGQIFNGADDNASGVAAMLELARLIRAHPLHHRVLFVALDAEESGLVGARAFVASPPVSVSAMALNLNLDMVSRGDNGILWAVGTHQNPSLRPVLEAIETGPGITLSFGRDRPEDQGRDNWVMLSDQAAFHAAGVPFIFFSVDDHPDYHQPTDVAANIDPQWYEASVQTIWNALRAMDAHLAGQQP